MLHGMQEEADSAIDDDEYDMRMFGISRALPVPEGPPDLTSGPPQTAEEYMQWVRHEAMQCPQVMRVEISPEKLKGRSPAADSTAVGTGGECFGTWMELKSIGS
jgi:hypothetical protein